MQTTSLLLPNVTAQQAADLLADIPAGRFLSIDYTAGVTRDRLTPETARHVVQLGPSARNVAATNLQRLHGILTTLSGVEAVAAQELCESLHKSATGTNTATRDGTYSHVGGENNGVIYIHATGLFHFRGVRVSKVVSVPGTYRVVKSSDKTLAKRRVEKLAGFRSWAEFKLTPEQVNGLRFNGETLELVGL